MQVTKEQITAAKQMCAMEYLKRYEPDRLKRCSKGEYELTDHGSFKINERSSLWHWKSRDIGGKSALDFLVYVDGRQFTDVVLQLCGESPAYVPPAHAKAVNGFALPPAAPDNKKVAAYLKNRGIDESTIRLCLESGILYESKDYHNAVFVGKDGRGIPRYAALRGTYDVSGKKPFKVEQSGSLKEYCFCLPAEPGSVRLALYESAIECLAHRTLEHDDDSKWRLSLGGIYAPKEGEPDRELKRPLALCCFILSHPEITELELCLNNDFAGRWATRHLKAMYEDFFTVIENLPQKEGYDYAMSAKESMKHKRREVER